MAFEYPLFGDFARPPSYGERVTLADVAEDDLVGVGKYWEDLDEWYDATGERPDSWAYAVDVQMIDLETGEMGIGYFDGAKEQPNGRYTV